MTTMKNESVFMNSYDDVIANYKGNDYEEFMTLFDEYDVAEMIDYLVDYDYSYLPVKEVKEAVIADYVKELLCECINDRVVYGTANMLRIVNEVL